MKQLSYTMKTVTNLKTIKNFSFCRTENIQLLHKKDEPINAVKESIAVTANVKLTL